MKKKKMTRFFAVALAVAMALPTVTTTVKAEESVEDYTLYPNPHTLTYEDGTYILNKSINVIYDDEIDEATKDRLQETAALKGISVSESDAEKKGKTNIYVGVYGSDDSVDEKIIADNGVDTDIFEKTDSYFLKSDDNVISVLGKDADASFYGLTTLYHIFAQMDSLTIRNFTIYDYADVVSRGFIEGYYGNPWSTEDRVNLMTWGGYYKLNAYFYAPKDDPKHRTNWNSLYTEEEVQSKIKPLADAGNASKCRFVYALHPFPGGNAFRFDTEAHYQEDLTKLKTKFKQVIDAGVRQIAILADDFVNPGASNELRLLNDMTDWLKDEVKEEYPDMKTTIPFVPYDYGGNGSSSELQTLKNAPDNIQIVMTGGRVWGEVTNSFTSTFTKNVGRGPFMWINWPCSDNSHKHLIMGGYSTFLHPGVDPENIQGIMLNPMQQSEPSKVAIFGNAAYSWNIWETQEEADQAWDDSFAFVDHNSAIETESSNALRELSKHMINQNMDSRVSVLQESVELKLQLNDFKEKLSNGTVTDADVDSLIEEFQILQDAAEVYKVSGNEDVREQIIYWLDCWKDTTDAAIAYLNGVKSAIAGDVSSVVAYNTAGAAAFAQSQTHEFLYVDYQEIAEVGVQHIVPFIKTLAEYVSGKAELALNPDKVLQTYITSRTDSPVGSVDNIFDGSDSTSAVYQTPNSITEGTYVGVSYSKAIEIENIRFLLGAGKDHMDQAKLQYTADGDTWQDLELIDMENSFAGVRNQNQEVVVEKENLPENFQAKGIRLIATADNANDAWLQVCEITINKKAAVEESEKVTGTVTFSGMGIRNNVATTKLFDGDASSEIWLAKDPYEGDDREKLAVGSTLTVTFDAPKKIGTVTLKQGASASGDVLSNALLQYQISGSDQWQNGGTITNATEQTIDLGLVENVAAIRIYNNAVTAGWVRIGEIDIRTAVETEDGSSKWLFTNVDSCGALGTQTEGAVSLKPASVTLGTDEYVGIDLGNIKAVTNIAVDADVSLKLQRSLNGVEWTDVTDKAEHADARYIRLYNAGTSAVTANWTAFSVSYNFIGEKSVSSTFANSSSTRDMRTAGTVNKVFDGDLTTFGSIAGGQDASKEIVFDLGQSINFTSIRYYVKETSKDFLRYAKFEVSDDPNAGDDAWTTVLTVGDDSFENTYDETTAKEYASLTHDSQNPGNMYAEQTGLNVSGRYLRVVPLKTYSYRWVDFYEIQINGGTYISPETNRDIISTVVEEPTKVPSNVFADDYSSVYKPSAANGSFTYRISDLDPMRTIRLIQNGAVSNAEVSARIANADGSNPEIVALGKLNQAINEFAVPTEKRILDVTVTWTDKIPEISMIKVYGRARVQIDKNELSAALEMAGTDASQNWTADSEAAVAQAKSIAQNVFDNVYATQDTVDSAAGALKSAINAAKEKAGSDVTSVLQNAVSNKKSQKENDVEIYTTVSYAAYEGVISRIAAALQDTNNLTKEDAEKLRDQLTEKESGLVYSKVERELAELDLAANGSLSAANYTKESYDVYAKACNELTALVEADKVNRVIPTEMAVKRAEFEKAVSDLVSVNNPFVDVNADAYYYDAVLWAVGEGITSGTTVTTFSPKADCTRAQVVMFLWRAAGSPTETIAANPFSDVSEGSRFYPAIVWAYNNGITTGYRDGTFRPDDSVRRGEYITFQYRAAGYPEVTLTENPFADVTEAAFPHYYDAIMWAAEHEITLGKDGNFLPNDNCARCNVVTFLYRANNL